MSSNAALSAAVAARVRRELAAKTLADPAKDDPAPTRSGEPSAPQPRPPLLHRIRSWLDRYRRLPAEIDALTKRVAEQERRLSALDAAHQAAISRLGRFEADLQFHHRRLARLAGSGVPERAPPATPVRATIPGLRDLPLETVEQRRARLARHFDRVKDWPTLRPGGPLLDIGCSDGEWLTLLQSAAIEACGVDIDGQAIEDARALGMNVQLAEGIGHLSGLPTGSLGGVSALRLVEYLDLDQTDHLLAEARRTLISGGLLLIETPNAASLAVTTRTFWEDPRRNRPLPERLLRCLAESHGFAVEATSKDGVSGPPADPADLTMIARKL